VILIGILKFYGKTMTHILTSKKNDLTVQFLSKSGGGTVAIDRQALSRIASGSVFADMFESELAWDKPLTLEAPPAALHLLKQVAEERPPAVLPPEADRLGLLWFAHEYNLPCLVGPAYASRRLTAEEAARLCAGLELRSFPAQAPEIAPAADFLLSHPKAARKALSAQKQDARTVIMAHLQSRFAALLAPASPNLSNALFKALQLQVVGANKGSMNPARRLDPETIANLVEAGAVESIGVLARCGLLDPNFKFSWDYRNPGGFFCAQCISRGRESLLFRTLASRQEHMACILIECGACVFEGYSGTDTFTFDGIRPEITNRKTLSSLDCALQLRLPAATRTLMQYGAAADLHATDLLREVAPMPPAFAASLLIFSGRDLNASALKAALTDTTHPQTRPLLQASLDMRLAEEQLGGLRSLWWYIDARTRAETARLKGIYERALAEAVASASKPTAEAAA
jgi:hypothetical protein